MNHQPDETDIAITNCIATQEAGQMGIFIARYTDASREAWFAIRELNPASVPMRCHPRAAIYERESGVKLVVVALRFTDRYYALPLDICRPDNLECVKGLSRQCALVTCFSGRKPSSTSGSANAGAIIGKTTTSKGHP